jgi:cytochrome c-type biogenesis protein CcmF
LFVSSFFAPPSSLAALRALHLFAPKEHRYFDYRKASRVLLFATLGVAILLAAVWESMFLTTDLTSHYVWAHSAREHTLLWKVEGLWAGQEGSIFLWATSMTTALAVNEWLTIRRERAGPVKPKGKKPASNPGRLGDWTALFVLIVIASFGVVLAASDWFAATTPRMFIDYPSGMGLSPTLRTELNAIHPPIELTGYALTVMPMAAAFAYLATGDKGWIRYCSFWTRIAWIFLTMGLTIGGLWAYITLGWGGYWAWDPVEVASLLPWLATTALLHAQVMHKRNEMYPLAAPLLAAIAFSLTEFGTFVTRSGVWNSVHSFIASPNTNLGDALLRALSSDIRLAVFFAMIFVPIGILLVLLWHFLRSHYREVSFLPPRGADEDAVDYIAQDKFTVFAGILMLCAILLMTFVILVKNAGIAPQPQEYETKLAIPLFVIMFFLTVNYLRRPLGNENALLVATVASFGSAMAFILFPAPPDAPYYKLAGAAIPLVLAVFLMGTLRVRGALRRGIPSSLKARARTLAVILAHVGMACVVLGYVTTNAFASEEQTIVGTAAGTESAVNDNAYGYTFVLLSLTKDSNAGASASEHWDKFSATYELRDGAGGLVRTGVAFMVLERVSPVPTTEFFNTSDYILPARLVHTDIYSTPTHDLYIQIRGLFPRETNNTAFVQLSIKNIPGIWGIWVGVIMMVGGMVTLMNVEYSAQRKGGERFVPADDPAGSGRKLPTPAPQGEAPAVEASAPGK